MQHPVSMQPRPNDDDDNGNDDNDSPVRGAVDLDRDDNDKVVVDSNNYKNNDTTFTKTRNAAEEEEEGDDNNNKAWTNQHLWTMMIASWEEDSAFQDYTWATTTLKEEAEVPCTTHTKSAPKFQPPQQQARRLCQLGRWMATGQYLRILHGQEDDEHDVARRLFQPPVPDHHEPNTTTTTTTTTNTTTTNTANNNNNNNSSSNEYDCGGGGPVWNALRQRIHSMMMQVEEESSSSSSSLQDEETNNNHHHHHHFHLLFQLELIAVAALNLFWQANYTGPAQLDQDPNHYDYHHCHDDDDDDDSSRPSNAWLLERVHPHASITALLLSSSSKSNQIQERTTHETRTTAPEPMHPPQPNDEQPPQPPPQGEVKNDASSSANDNSDNDNDNDKNNNHDKNNNNHDNDQNHKTGGRNRHGRLGPFFKNAILSELAVEGEWPCPISEYPYFLLVARAILSTLLLLFLDHSLVVESPPNCCRRRPPCFQGLHVWHARALVAHVRLLQAKVGEVPTTLAHQVLDTWETCTTLFGNGAGTGGGGTNQEDGPSALLSSYSAAAAAAAPSSLVSSSQSSLQRLATVWLERGLAHYHLHHPEQQQQSPNPNEYNNDRSSSRNNKKQDFQPPPKQQQQRRRNMGGRACFVQAQNCSGLQVHLTGAMGKRTKYQQEAKAQLRVHAQSSSSTMSSASLSSSSTTTTTTPITTTTTTDYASNQGSMPTIEESQEPVKDDGKGTAAVAAAAAAATTIVEPKVSSESTEKQPHATNSVLTTSNYSADDRSSSSSRPPVIQAVEHPEDTILLDRIEYCSDEDDEPKKENNQQQQQQQQSDGNKQLPRDQPLSRLDQAIVLALCLDVKNSNPTADVLTAEEMGAFLARVLDDAHNTNNNNNNNNNNSKKNDQDTNNDSTTTDHDNNNPYQHPDWMIYSTALLERAWLEFERPHAKERAILQLQALVDQHDTHRLTMTQSTHSSITTDSAPVQLRLRYLHTLVYPPRWAFLNDLAVRYAHLGLVTSAAELYTEIELWDDVVDCYTRAGKRSKAESIVRERLRYDAETPRRWTALGDLTQDITCYEKAIVVSHRRYAKAFIALGQHYFDQNELPLALENYHQALQLRPLAPHIWFRYGTIAMRLEQWDVALGAFSEVVQQEPEEAEAWANVAAVHLHNRCPEQAYPALKESLKYQRNNWRVWVSQLYTCLDLQKWNEALQACQMLLDLQRTRGQADQIPPLEEKCVRALVGGALQNYLKERQQHTFETNKEDNQQESSSSTTMTTTPSESSSPVSTSLGSLESARRTLLRTHALLERIASTATSATTTPWILECLSFLQQSMGADDKVLLEYLMQEYRTLQNVPRWEWDDDLRSKLCDVVAHIISLRKLEGSRDALVKSRLLLRGIHKKIATVAADVAADGAGAGSSSSQRYVTLTQQVDKIQALLTEVEAKLEEEKIIKS